MAKNLIPQIAKMLGVELGEEFKVKGREYIFHFVDNGLIAYRTDGSVLPYENCLAHFLWLINGEEEIVKMPWEPKEGQTVYSFYSVGLDGVLKVVDFVWMNDVITFQALVKAGWVYKTCAEAQAALPTVAKELGVEYKL